MTVWWGWEGVGRGFLQVDQAERFGCQYAYVYMMDMVMRNSVSTVISICKQRSHYKRDTNLVSRHQFDKQMRR